MSISPDGHVASVSVPVPDHHNEGVAYVLICTSESDIDHVPVNRSKGGVALCTGDLHLHIWGL